MSEGKDMLISKFYDSLMVSRTITEIERRFLQYFDSLKLGTLLKKPFPLNKLNFRTMDGSNIFHFLVQDYKILKRFYNNLTKHIESFDDEDEKKRQLQIYLADLVPKQPRGESFGHCDEAKLIVRGSVSQDVDRCTRLRPFKVHL